MVDLLFWDRSCLLWWGPWIYMQVEEWTDDKYELITCVSLLIAPYSYSILYYPVKAPCQLCPPLSQLGFSNLIASKWDCANFLLCKNTFVNSMQKCAVALLKSCVWPSATFTTMLAQHLNVLFAKECIIESFLVTVETQDTLPIAFWTMYRTDIHQLCCIYAGCKVED